jgi:hypothetical protein
MLELILIVGIVVISVLLGQVIRWIKNTYNVLGVINNNIRMLVEGFVTMYKDNPDDEKRAYYQSVIRGLERESVSEYLSGIK